MTEENKDKKTIVDGILDHLNSEAEPDQEEPKGLNDEEMDKFKKELTDLFTSIDWDKLAEDEEDEEEE